MERRAALAPRSPVPQDILAACSPGGIWSALRVRTAAAGALDHEPGASFGAFSGVSGAWALGWSIGARLGIIEAARNRGSIMKKFSSSLISVTMTLALAACAAKSPAPTEAPPADQPPPEDKAPPAEEPPAAEPAPADAAPSLPTKDIIDTAEDSDSFKTIVGLIEAAGLTNALREDGPLTVLVPDDAAFAKLDPGVLDKLRKDKKSLTALLNNHVLTGRAIKSVELGTMPSAKTAAGPEITIESVDGTIKINGTITVVKADVMTTNGVIHVIDTVILPAGKKKAK